MASFRSPLARVTGHGSAKAGAMHWWWQRITAVALVPLSIWFVFSLATFTGQCHIDIYGWIADPWSSALLIAFLASLFHHVQLGLQVVIEDYVHHEGVKIASIVGVKFLCAILAIVGSLAILEIAL